MNVTTARNRLDELLSESPASVCEREQNELERRVGSLDDPFILFGAGNLGRKTLRTLKRIGKAPIAFIDNNPALWNTKLEGISIMRPADAATWIDPGRVGVVTTIWCGEATDKMSDRIEPLKALGFRRIGLFGHLAWKFPDAFLPHYSLDLPSRVIEQRDRILEAFELLADDESRALFVAHVEWRLFADYDVLPVPSVEEIYFNDRFINNFAGEVLYDVGAFTGDSVKSFLSTERANAFSQVHSFEPSPDNYETLARYVASLEKYSGKLLAHKLALGDSIGQIQVESEHGPASRVGRGSESVSMTTIDEMARLTSAPTLIKIDIEGFEPECLRGARQTITDSAPAIAVCVYHLQSHIWDILLQLHTYQPRYTFRYCPHLADGWDLVLYAVTEQRRPI